MDMKSFAAVVIEEFASQYPKAGTGKLAPRKTKTGFAFDLEWTDTADAVTKSAAQVTAKELERFSDDEPEAAVELVVGRLLEAAGASAAE